MTATSNAGVDQFFQNMQVLELKDLGEVSKYLGMRVSRAENFDYGLGQTSMVCELVERFGLNSANSVRVPISKSPSGSEDSVLPIGGDLDAGLPSVQQFQSLVRSLL